MMQPALCRSPAPCCLLDALVRGLCTACRVKLLHVRLFATAWTVACQAPLSMGFSRHEYCSGLPCSPTGDLPNPGIKLRSLKSPALAGGFLTTEPQGRPLFNKLEHDYLLLLPYFWRRKWQPTPVFLDGQSHGQRSLVGYSPWVTKTWTQLK